MEQAKWKYTTLLQESGVRVKIPNMSQFTQFISAHSFNSENGPVVVPAHWKSGMAINGTKTDTVILNRHFYGIDREDLGKRITAIVKVVEKKEIGSDRVFTMVDIHKENGRAVADLKFAPEGDGILIAGTRTRINIVKRGPASKSEAQPAQSA